MTKTYKIIMKSSAINTLTYRSSVHRMKKYKIFKSFAGCYLTDVSAFGTAINGAFFPFFISKVVSASSFPFPRFDLLKFGCVSLKNFF